VGKIGGIGARFYDCHASGRMPPDRGNGSTAVIASGCGDRRSDRGGPREGKQSKENLGKGQDTAASASGKVLRYAKGFGKER